MKIHTLPQDLFFEMIDPQILEQSPEKFSETLTYLAKKITDVMKADVCSLYLYNSESDTLTLKATHGLNSNLVDHLTFKTSVGLTGMTLKFLKPITVSNVSKNKMFFPITNLGEENFKSFLSIPLLYSQKPIGVLVVQNRKPTLYKKKDIQLLLSLAIPAVSIIERARFMGTIHSLNPDTEKKNSKKSSTKFEYLKDHVMKGIPASGGLAIGKLKIVKAEIHDHKAEIIPDALPQKKEKFLNALQWVKQDVHETREKAALKFGPEELGIFEAYSLILEDKNFEKQILYNIEVEKDVVKAIELVIKKYTDRISNSDDEYIRERSYDIQDIAQKIIDRLLYAGKKINETVFHVQEDTIFLYDNWSISDFTLLDSQFTKGLISANGGANSHVSLLADAGSYPAVFGLGSAVSQLKDGDNVVVDGSHGVVIVNPSTETINTYKKNLLDLEEQKRLYHKSKSKKIVLTSQKKLIKSFPIGANIELMPHIGMALQCGADEVGLYRTEFPFLTALHLPTENEQFEHYSQVIKWMKGKEVTFRTLDIGGDKYLPYLDLPHETNPFLGWRSIRFSLGRRDLFRIQLRALVRAAQFGKIRILFPMITNMEEVFEIKQTLKTVYKELHDEGEKFPTQIPIGFMIEVPAACEIADQLAQQADFLSIGTNDLIQYGLAVDRSNPLVANLYDPFHPAILKMIQKTVKAAHKYKITVSVCGETAAKPMMAALLVGLGVDSFSMNPQSIPRIKHFLRNTSYDAMYKLTQKVLKLGSGTEIKTLVKNYFLQNNWQEFITQSTES